MREKRLTSDEVKRHCGFVPNISLQSSVIAMITLNRLIASTRRRRWKAVQSRTTSPAASFQPSPHIPAPPPYVLEYCVRKRLISFNPAKDVDYKSLPIVKSASSRGKIKKTPFTPEQTKDVLAWCDLELTKKRINKLHPLGIKFAIEMAARYGELRGLRWEDIDFVNRTVTICDQSVQNYEMQVDEANGEISFTYNGRLPNGHIKGYEDPVPLPLSDIALEALKTIRSLNLDEDYVFPAEHFRYNTFNDKVKDAAESIGLNRKKYSSHSLRTTAATNLYLKTRDIFQVQRLLHHTTPEMTMKYIKDLDISERLRHSMCGSLTKMW